MSGNPSEAVRIERHKLLLFHHAFFCLESVGEDYGAFADRGYEAFAIFVSHKFAVLGVVVGAPVVGLTGGNLEVLGEVVPDGNRHVNHSYQLSTIGIYGYA